MTVDPKAAAPRDLETKRRESALAKILEAEVLVTVLSRSRAADERYRPLLLKEAAIKSRLTIAGK